ncbi:PhzF family phenazine biosynthesis protein [Stenotrophomonas sp. HMWF003]|uniref:PhzF family phenazine biosynthesis protein n=1 Tax=Stenotrophomonas sp. HMWF003 TaxID=2056840 RepID=UPI000D4C2A4D|nr:PhzF family phenazine biosynthesis protein [Stenotrophomonas sp. HMWF003]PTT64669.1 phenazine biosynthesis protein PhzF [Stenotrophomonas sp. HMWF003]
MLQLRYTQVDVFSAIPTRGNPVGIVHCDASPSDDFMFGVARWLGLSETVFLLPPSNPEADYRVRIWSTLGELPFAGHPTLGACHAWIESGGVPRAAHIVQECGIGLVKIRHSEQIIDGSIGCHLQAPDSRPVATLAFMAPPLLRGGPVSHELLALVCKGLNLEPGSVLDAEWVDNGAGWLALLLQEDKDVLAVLPDYSKLSGLAVGIIAPVESQPIASASLFESRAFIAGDAVPEDPATGSLQAGIGLWFSRRGFGADRYTVRQGTCMGRLGRILVHREHGEVWVGGSTTTCISGTISAPERHEE